MAVLLAALTAVLACAHADTTAAPPEQQPVVQQPPNEARPLPAADAEALAEFKERVEQYAKVHQRLEATLPPLPKETTPTVIDSHQRAFGKLIQQERRNAKQGDLLTTNVRRYFRRVLARVFSGPGGKELIATILDESPGPIRLAVNSRYPDEVPLSTVPPQVLSSLPKLPEELEYRFVGDRLVLLDVHAHVIVDLMDQVFPR
jgi:hypothetical protein